MIPTTETPSGELGTVEIPFFGDRREAIRDDAGVVYIKSFGSWHGYTPNHRISRSFRAGSCSCSVPSATAHDCSQIPRTTEWIT